MANVKITDLNQDTAPASTDVLPFVDISSDETKKVTVEDLLESAGDGAAATPAFSFDSDKNTGIYRPGADQLAISTGGTGRLFIDSSGRLGVGTSSPSSIIHAAANTPELRLQALGSASANSSDARLGFYHSGGTKTAEIGFTATGDNTSLKFQSTVATGLGLGTNSTTALYIDSSQRIGVGTASPQNNLHLSSSAAVTRFQITNSTTAEGSSDGTALIQTGNTFLINNRENDDIYFATNNSEAVRIDSAGNVGVGTSSPSTIFHLNTATGNNLQAFSLADSVKAYIGLSAATNSPLIGAAVNDLCFRSENANIKFGTASSTRTDLTIDSSGNVGIGTTSPSTLLELSENQGTTITLRRNSSAAVADDLIGKLDFFNNDGSSPGARVTATVGAYAQSTAGGTYLAFSTATNGGSNAERLRIDSSGDILAKTIDARIGSDVGAIEYGTSTLNSCRFYTNDQERLRIDSSGRVGIGTSSLSRMLTVDNDGESFIHIRSSNTGNAGIEFGDQGDSVQSAIFHNATDNSLRFNGYNNAERMRIDSSGNVGVGTTSPGNGAILHANGAIISTTGTLNSFNFDNTGFDYSSNNGRFFATATGASGGNLTFTTGNNGSYSERVRIDSSGNLGVGTTSPVAKIESNVTSDGAESARFRISGLTNNPIMRFIHHESVGTQIDLNGTTSNATELYVTQVGSERARIDSSGRLLVGTSNSRDDGVSLQVEGVGYLPSTIQITRNSANADGGGIYIQKTRGSSNGSTTIVQNDDELGYIKFRGADGTDAKSIGAQISAEVDGTPGSNDMPGRLVFSTTADGASSPTERMRITSEGYVFLDATSSGLQGNINTTSAGLKVVSLASTSDAKVECFATSTATRYGIVFSNPNGVVGSISTNGSATAYNTSSDHRLKENVVDIADGITRVKQLQPRRFNFIADAETTVDGFIAHEAQTVVPEAVTGTKDEVNDDGNAVMQGIDQSKLVPLLTAALQEAIAKIETLEQRLTDGGL